MPAGDYGYDDTSLMQGYHHPPPQSHPGDQSAASILRSVKEQEVQFERLTRELEAERESVAHQLDKCKLGSDTASMNSMSSNDDAYHWRSPAHNDLSDSRLDDDSDLHAPKIESSLLLDSCLRELEDRGTMNFDNMEYIHDENYHGMNPAYMSSMMNGGNPAYDRHNEGSPHSSRLSVQSGGSNHHGDNRNVHKLNNIRGRGSISSQDHQMDNYMSYNAINRNLDSPSPHGGAQTPTRGPPTPTRDHGYPGSRGSYQAGSDRGTPTFREHGYHGDPRNMDPEPRYGEPAPYDGYDDNIPRQEAFGNQHGHNYRDSPGLEDGYRSNHPDGGPYGSHPDDHYPGDHYDDHYGGPHGDDYYPPPPPPNGQFREDDRYGDIHPDDRRDGTQYDGRYDGPPDERYGGPHDDSYGGPAPDSRFEPHPDDRYRELPPDDRYRDSPEQLQDPQREPPYEDGYQAQHLEDRPDLYPVEHFQDGPPEGYLEPHIEERLRQAPPEGDDRYRNVDNGYGENRYDGLPPVHQDPFADDPFNEGGPHDPSRYHAPPEDPYARRTPSPAAGSDRYGYGEAPRYGQEAPTMDNYGPDRRVGRDPYDDEGHRPQGYDDMDRPPYEDDPRMGGPHNLSAEDEEGHRWRNPDLQEVIELLRNPNDEIKANAAAFLQHLCYMDNDMKAKTRSLDGIPPLVEMLASDFPEVHKNALGALKNLSYGKENDLCKKAIRSCGGIPCLVRLLRRPLDDEVKDLVTGVLWNMSSSEDLKKPIIDETLVVLVNFVIIPPAGWDHRYPPSSQKIPVNVHWTTDLRNATGVLRNVSSHGFEARKKLRECQGLVDSLVLYLRAALEQHVYDNKCVENCVCIMRNLSFRCQEVIDPDFHKKRATLRRQPVPEKGEQAGCFGGGGKKKKAGGKYDPKKPDIMSQGETMTPNAPRPGMEQLWHPEIVQVYKEFMVESSNPVTLEALAGATQNIAACDWMPSVEFRAAVRKAKMLPVIVDLLRMESDRVVCAAGIALRNLAIDEKNKELIGKYAMQRLVSKLPAPNVKSTSPDDTICAILATLHEVIKDHADFALFLFRESGVPPLRDIAQSRHRYTARTIKFASSVLRTMWQFRELQSVYKREGYTDRDFLTVSTMARPESATSPPPSNVNTPYNTLSRPISNQGYDDTTLSSPYSVSKANHHANHGHKMATGRMMGYSNPAHLHAPDTDRYGNRERQDHKQPEQHIPMREIGSGYAAVEDHPPSYNDYKRSKPPVGGVPLFPNLEPGASVPEEPREPLYAQVNKSGRRRPEEGGAPAHLMLEGGAGQGGADSWV
ncbi:catenin delta-2-like isoform X3 [Liolophura sinensis]|uniref:catenin delta-2-like isoform X3 n=1 Tax=Liolophura sinensis TaxID=3198878 RepID=UPI003158B306